MAGHQRVYALKDRVRRGDVAQGEIVAQSRDGELFLHKPGVCKRRELFGRGDEVLPRRPVERQAAEVVAGKEQALFLEVDQHEGKLALHVPEETLPVLAPGGDPLLRVLMREQGIVIAVDRAAEAGHSPPSGTPAEKTSSKG